MLQLLKILGSSPWLKRNRFLSERMHFHCGSANRDNSYGQNAPLPGQQGNESERPPKLEMIHDFQRCPAIYSFFELNGSRERGLADWKCKGGYERNQLLKIRAMALREATVRIAMRSQYPRSSKDVVNFAMI